MLRENNKNSQKFPNEKDCIEVKSRNKWNLSEVKVITELVVTGENEKVEFKPSSSQLYNIRRLVSAFSNVKVRMVVVGVSDEGKIF